MKQNARGFDRRLFLAYVVSSLIAIFYLPTLVPVQLVKSESYLFGYNNRAGIVLLLLFVTIGAVWTKGLNLPLRTKGDSKPVSLKILAASMIAVLLGCMAMYMLAGRFGGFGESAYEINRLWLTSQGKIPYVNFEFAYGALFLYFPLLLQRLLPINLVQAYYLSWVLHYLLGTLLLWAVINMVDYPTTSKRSIFLLLYGTGIMTIIEMGSHYTFLRYICPIYFILVIYKLFSRDGNRSQIYALLLAVVFTITLLLISPETSIAFAFGCICIFLLSHQCHRPRSLVLFVGLPLAFIIVFSAALKLHILDTLIEFGGGANNYPIALAPHLLLFFAAFFGCACYVFRRFSEPRIDDNTIALIAFSIPMIAAALGRCASGHVIFNGIGIFMASMFYISSYRTAWKWYRAVFAVVMILLPALSLTWLYLPSLARCGFNIISEDNYSSQIGRSLTNYMGRKYIAYFASPSKRAKWEKALENAPHTGVPKTIDFSSIYPTWHGTFLAPFDYRPNGIGTYFTDKIDYGYYEGILNAFTVAAIQVKLTEIKNHPEKALLLPDHFENNCPVNIPAERQLLSVEFAVPYFGKAVHPESVSQPICDYILAQYKLEQEPSLLQNFSYGLWVAKPVAGGTSQSGKSSP